MDGTHTIFFSVEFTATVTISPNLEKREKNDNVRTITLNIGQLMWENNCAEVLIICFPFLQFIENRFLHWQKKKNKAQNFRILDDITDREKN